MLLVGNNDHREYVLLVSDDEDEDPVADHHWTNEADDFVNDEPMTAAFAVFKEALYQSMDSNLGQLPSAGEDDSSEYQPNTLSDMKFDPCLIVKNQATRFCGDEGVRAQPFSILKVRKVESNVSHQKSLSIAPDLMLLDTEDETSSETTISTVPESLRAVVFADEIKGRALSTVHYYPKEKHIPALNQRVVL